jgi:hypothetical protein
MVRSVLAVVALMLLAPACAANTAGQVLPCKLTPPRSLEGYPPPGGFRQTEVLGSAEITIAGAVLDQFTCEPARAAQVQVWVAGQPDGAGDGGAVLLTDEAGRFELKVSRPDVAYGSALPPPIYVAALVSGRQAAAVVVVTEDDAYDIELVG